MLRVCAKELNFALWYKDEKAPKIIANAGKFCMAIEYGAFFCRTM